MNRLAWLTGIFLGFTRGFTPFECRVLEDLASCLSSDRAEKLRLRISQINRVYRLDGGREVNCYVMRSGKPVLPTETKIGFQQGESALAEFSVEADDLLTKNEGSIVLIDGNLFSLLFREPTEHASVDNVHGITFDVMKGSSTD